MAALDPFDEAKRMVRSSLEETSKLFEACQAEALRGKQPARQRQLETNLSQLATDVAELERVVKLTEERPDRFPVSVSELRTRKTFLLSSGRAVSRMKDIVGRWGKSPPQPSHSFKQPPPQARNREFISGQREQQQLLIGQQDQQLEELALCAERLNQTATVINSEIHDHNRALVELDEDVDRQRDKMNFVTSRMAKVLKTNDGRKLYTILGLFLTFVLLLLMVIYI